MIIELLYGQGKLDHVPVDWKYNRHIQADVAS